ncbi:hypothetical protein PSECIP111854_02302 [Pseudoalteromonas sp. CIP111854]|uniref:D-alanyl-D-alanine carboxypeptidase-like core domain-containing protein n=1 Tax=Pseudoalteromonas holothuriae TaxID=2963714 RepID=A0A9W4VR91_9GAMM|nr:M15 family metallopeptidase [Pseudoalteromonas sp. CIP111854]CAH9058932.1 hypothetical protein PSECIP111854_02302 [Pseudoalteromonas sp. CIP111854]
MDMSKIACGLSDAHLACWQNIYVHKDIIDDLNMLSSAAKRDGFELRIASSYRGFERQAAIWNAKFAKQRPVYDINGQEVDLSKLDEQAKCEAIMLFSALPGGSRHHFGSDLDIYAANCLAPNQNLQLEPWEYQLGGPFAEFSNWLDEHLQTYSFFKPYNCYQGGVAQEPWHISHQRVAKQLEQYQSTHNIAAALKNQEVLGKKAILSNLAMLHKRFISNITYPN